MRMKEGEVIGTESGLSEEGGTCTKQATPSENNEEWLSQLKCRNHNNITLSAQQLNSYERMQKIENEPITKVTETAIMTVSTRCNERT